MSHTYFLMVECRKHTLSKAALFASCGLSNFSKILRNHSSFAIYTFSELSKRQAKQFSRAMRFLGNNQLPWKVALIVDSTLQRRSSSLYPENVKRFNHGKGFVIGHQWTNVVLIINDVLIPLEPFAFLTTKYCKEHNIEYLTENKRVVQYIENLKLREYIGSYNPKEVIFLADSGYDDKKIQKAIKKRKWNFIIALKNSRTVMSRKNYNSGSKDWTNVELFFKKNRWIKWITVSVPKNSHKKKRTEFSIRQVIAYLKNVGKVQLICSEFKKGPKGRRKHLACSDLKATARQISIGYRVRWEIEIFHKMVKMYLGFEDVAPKHFSSVISHVHLVYCAYILLNCDIPGIPKEAKSISQKQKVIEELIHRKELSQYFQMLTQINGVQRLKNHLRQALASPLTF